MPLAPSWVIAEKTNVIARLIPDPVHKRFTFEIIEAVSDAEMETAIIGLLVLFIAVGDELNATSVYSRHVVTRNFLPASERAAYRFDARAALRPAFLMKLVGGAMVVVGYGGFFYFTVG